MMSGDMREAGLNKREFLAELRRMLRNYKSADVDGVVRFYDELISDKTENGMNEYLAVASLGNIHDIAGWCKAELVETRITEEKRAKNPIKTFFGLTALCTSPFLVILAITFSIVYLSLFITFFAVGISIFAGGVGMIVIFIANAFVTYGELRVAGVLMSLGAGIAAAAILCLLGIAFFKLSLLLIKSFLKMFARIISGSKRRKLDENFN